MIRKPELNTSIYCSGAELTVVKDIAARDALKVKDKQRVLVLDAAGDKIQGHAEYIYYLGDWYAITATVAGGGNTTIEKTGMTIIATENDLATIPLPINGDQAYALEGGVAYVYADGEWLELSRQGAKGDALKFEDLTEEQKEELKGPPGDKGERGEQGDPGASAESSKVYIFDRKSELSLLEDMVEGEHAYIKDDEMEYIFVDGEWKTIGGWTGGNADSILAEKVITNNDMQFISKDQKMIIRDNQKKIEKLEQDIAAIDINPASDGKVKFGLDDTLDYLTQKIGETLFVNQNSLEVKKLYGQTVTVDDVNQLTGVRSNLQKQIDGLSRAGNFTGSVEDKKTLLTLENPALNDMVIVLSDETHDNESTIYMHNNKDWVFAGKFSINVRDFQTAPLNLNNESTGKLTRDRVEAPLAKDVPVSDAEKHFVTPKNAESIFKQIGANLGALNDFKVLVEEKGDVEQEIVQVRKRRDLPKEGRINTLYIVDEDETNEKKTSVYVWIVDPLNNKGAYNVIISASVSGKMQEYQQVTKLGVKAPRVYELPIPRTRNFLRAPIEVLSFSKGTQNIKVDTKYSNEQQSDFMKNVLFTFDDKGFYLAENFIMDPSKKEIEDDFCYTEFELDTSLDITGIVFLHDEEEM